MKRISWMVGLLLCSFKLMACGSSQETEADGQVAEVNKHAIFREETNIFDVGNGDISSVILVNGELYVDSQIYSFASQEEDVMIEEGDDQETSSEEVAEESDGQEAEMSETLETETEVALVQTEGYLSSGLKRVIARISPEGEQSTVLELEYLNNESGGAFTVDEEGNIYTIHNQYASYQGDDTKDKVYLKSFDKDGKEVFSVHLNENMGEDEYYYAGGLYLTDNGKLVVDSYRGIEIYDLQGNPVNLIEKEGNEEGNLKRIRDGQFAIFSSNGQKAYARQIDLETGSQQEKVELPFNYYRYNIQNGNYYDLYMSDEYGVYGYNIGDSELTKLMDYISSDFSGNMIDRIIFSDENTFYGSYYGEMGSAFSRFTKVPPEEVVEKTELTLGCYGLDSRVKQQIIEFNKNSSAYKIHIHDYAIYDTMDDYTQGMTRLNTDIASGMVPDLMLLNPRMPVNSYISKGLFADFNELIEQDEEFKKEDFMPNVFEALSSKDGMYQMAPSFVVSTFVAKTADVGKEPGWTMEEAQKLLDSKPEGTVLLSEITSDNLLYYLTWIGIEDYVNWETGECNFDSPGFISTLEFAKTLPETIDYTGVMDDESYWNEMELQYRNGKTILNMSYLSGFRDFQYLKQGTFGEDITFIGFPTQQGIGAGLTFNINMAISSQSKNIDAAWDFVKEFFTEEFQDNLEYELPVRLSSLDKLEEEAWNRPFFLDENGNKEEYDDYYYLNGVEVKLEPLTKEETSYFKDYLKQVTNVASANEDIYNIILEEAAGFLKGQKSAAEVAEIIQSRVRIYVNENQ